LRVAVSRWSVLPSALAHDPKPAPSVTHHPAGLRWRSDLRACELAPAAL